ncbi:aldehyde dehydrogenase family protein [Vibrio cyclitrophicus]|uniref:aldehyde dehydrogenase family protein n=1 Tax=Vibrio cyclitrophicus TaxID=47951 RepID=UPI000C83B908|nr:aldehyde dehydrogenase family protein [Vibrio cyclitrophicus]MCC4772798.1 aldehyde dehydrogenase family protein [Vibrio cyclitrophicus]MCC4843830.1 aldehyde dehydrogenase family protein [Vibrio cyclitrophicus]PME10602.1 succinate-semialdehyde dehydrogenase [Vibrio cyclitrophicus]PME53101.1 succinate-semialdehyde dehydrogenase [Vibrio cyclitrophicus]PME84379.1 succinate-semialdehyde dehydrogenase [Vibrio cyclitrophicus]
MSKSIQSFNPSNGELLGEVNNASRDEVVQTIRQSKSAQKVWKKLPINERVRTIIRAYQHLDQYADSLSELLAREMGKDIRRATGEATGAIYMGQHYAEEAHRALNTRKLSGSTELQYRPLGVVGVISPWNYPVMMANNLIVPALVAGNSVILKPSEETPLIAEAFFGELQKHLPEGVLTILHGDRETGEALVEGDIQMIAFTGSKATGQDIMRRAASKVKRLVMELGGKDPMIVMRDANLEQAARFAVAGSFENSGQMCTSIERIYVDDRIAEKFEQRVTEIANMYQIGPWDMPNVNIGPIINATQHGKIVEQLKDAQQKGATFLLGGIEQPDRYIRPTVITGMTPEMKLETEETFGPVVAITRYSNIDDAIERANASEYGLGAVVFGNQGANEVADELDAGMVGINQGQGGSGDAPWVGAKQSGLGYHGSVDGHRQFAQVKVVSK